MRLFPQPAYAVSLGVSLDDVPRHVEDHRYHGRVSIARNRTLQGDVVAHWKAWVRIASNGDNGAFVPEDDCVQY
eukprot:3123469-Lingulodinium_polyedra.AAC.1